MEGDRLRIFFSILLVLGNALFVAAEYGLVGARRTRIEALAKKGNRAAKALVASLSDLSRYVAGIQIAITMLGIGMGSMTEPMVSRWLEQLMGHVVGKTLSVAISLVLVTFVLVVVGELVPKYLTLKYAEQVALALIFPLRGFVSIVSPLVWLAQRSGGLILKLLRVPMEDTLGEGISKEELRLLVRSGTSEGALDEMHAQVISKALRFDELDASDVMIHRIDIKWLDIDTPKEELLGALGRIKHSRVPVCDKDIDHVVGVLYLNDLVRHWQSQDFSLAGLLRPVEVVPENLTLNRIVNRMRESRTQILVVVDEYGGTSGLITLEDVVEEVFGELDDQLEGERPAIEWVNPRRISARADVRFDELLEFMGVEGYGDSEASTDTLATILINGLGRMARMGDSLELPLGTLRVENMARRRITRVGLQLPRDTLPVS